MSSNHVTGPNSIPSLRLQTPSTCYCKQITFILSYYTSALQIVVITHYKPINNVDKTLLLGLPRKQNGRPIGYNKREGAAREFIDYC